FNYARAGHELPLMRMVEGQVSLAAMQVGQPIGIIDDILLDQGSLQIVPGGMLILYTDGVTDERSPEGERFGGARFQELVHIMLDEGAQPACDHIMHTVLSFLEGAQQDDDITVVAIKNTA
ncbi:MAG: PP2C family protein-serine/threonine phosphatase, partial [Anaerolineales bacterium]